LHHSCYQLEDRFTAQANTGHCCRLINLGLRIASSFLEFVWTNRNVLSKGAVTTTCIWALHLHLGLQFSGHVGLVSTLSQLSSPSVVFIWLSTLCFRGTHFTQFPFWAVSTIPTANVSTPSLGQSFLNLADDGQHLFAGLFYIWRSIGLVNQLGLKSPALVCLASSAFSIIAVHFHLVSKPSCSWIHLVSLSNLR
jgi:hypothetical protein